MRSHRLLPLALCLAASGCLDCVGTPGLQRATLQLEVSPVDVTFPPTWAGVEARAGVTLRNAGNAPVRLTAVDIGQVNAFVLSARPPETLEAGETLTLEVIFRPESDGPQQTTLRITNTSDNNPNAAVELRGTGRLIPLCDDHNSCTADLFDVAGERCVFQPREGDCNDDNACTDGDRCVDGACRGVGRRCDDFNICTLDACDPLRGCFNPPDGQRCADPDPCTADLCDPVTGCSHAPAPDGTPCAPVQGCTSLFLCASGSCTAYPVPDNFPCFDGDICSVGDRCVMGSCQGSRDPSPPEVAQVLPTFGGATSVAVVVDGNRVLFLDGEPARRVAWTDPVTGNYQEAVPAPQRPVFTSVTLGEAALESGQHLVMQHNSVLVGPMVLLDTTHVAVVSQQGDAAALVEFLEQAPDGSWSTVSTASFLLSHGRPHRAVAMDGVVYSCHGQGVGAVDARDVTQPVLSLFQPVGACKDMVLVPAVGEIPARVLALVEGGTPTRPAGLGWIQLGMVDTIPNIVGDVTALPVDQRHRESDATTRVLALHRATDPSRTSGTQIQLRNPVTLQLLSTLQLDATVERGMGLCLTGNHLVTMRFDNDLSRPRLVVLNVEDPATPTVASTRLLVPPALVNFIALDDVLDWGAALTCEHGVVVAGPLTYRLSPDGTLVPLTAPDHGSVRQLVRLGDELHAVHASATRRVVVPPSGPARLEGLGVMEVSANVVRVGTGAGQDVFPAHPYAGISNDPLVAFLFDGMVWAQAQAQTPVPVRRVDMDGTGRAALAVGDVVWTLPTNTPAVVVERTQLNIPWSTSAVAFTPDVSLELSATTGIGSGYPVTLAASADGSRLVVVPVRGAMTPLVVVEHSGGLLREVARTLVPTVPDGPPGSAALWNDTLLLVQSPVDVVAGGAGGVVLLMQVNASNQTVEVAARLELQGALRVLVFDGVNAAISTFAGITFVQALGTTLRVLGSVPTPAPVTDAQVYQDRLILAGENGVVVVSPPCPPL